jgi:hypothetical protein
MTTTDTHPTSTPEHPHRTIDGEVVYSDAALAPPKNPYRFAANASGVVLLGAGFGMATQVGHTAIDATVSGAAFAAALLVWLRANAKFHARADAGDR